jgi:hypothetical protein
LYLRAARGGDDFGGGILAPGGEEAPRPLPLLESILGPKLDPSPDSTSIEDRCCRD